MCCSRIPKKGLDLLEEINSEPAKPCAQTVLGMVPNHICSSASLLQSPVLRWRTSSCFYHVPVLLRNQAWEKITIASLLFGGFNTVVSFVMSLELSSISWTEECPSLSDEVLWLVPQIPRLDKSLLIHLLRAGISGGPL